MKAYVHLCSEHIDELTPKKQLIDDILICQEVNCFNLATWRYVIDIEENRRAKAFDKS